MATEVKSIMDLSIEDLNISARTYGCLYKAGILTVEDVLLKDTSDSIGKMALKETYEAIRKLGLNIEALD